MSDDSTQPRTLWTETLLDLLRDAMQRQREEDVARLLREIRAKGVRKADVMRYARRNFEPDKVTQLDRMIKQTMGRGRKAG